MPCTRAGRLPSCAAGHPPRAPSTPSPLSTAACSALGASAAVGITSVTWPSSTSAHAPRPPVTASTPTRHPPPPPRLSSAREWRPPSCTVGCWCLGASTVAARSVRTLSSLMWAHASSAHSSRPVRSRREAYQCGCSAATSWQRRRRWRRFASLGRLAPARLVASTSAPPSSAAISRRALSRASSTSCLKGR